ncbi:molybdopterin-containing oxidoreductase family protein [Pseudochelatococcus sp. B33]
MAEQRIPGFCALCKSRCGSVMVTRDGRFIAQEANPEHPTGMSLCVKGKAAPELIYNEDRLLYPLMRTNPKGSADPGWKRISWDEALDRTANELARIRDTYGAEAVVIGLATPSGTPISDDIRWIERFANAFGTPNSADGTELCNWHKDHAHAYTYGRGISSPDFAQTNCVVLWGHNPSATWLDHATATVAAKARGAKLVVIDPRRVGFAPRADQWLRVRPGSDGALALGLARSMIRNKWFDEDFIRDWSSGPFLVRPDTGRFLRIRDLPSVFPDSDPDDLVAQDATSGELVPYSPKTGSYARPQIEPDLWARGEVDSRDAGRIVCMSAFSLYAKLCDDYPPEVVERICWIPAEQVDATAKLIATSGPVCYYGWTGIGQHTNATQTDRAIALCMALTGSFDAPGGNVVYAKPPAFSVARPDLMYPEQRAKCIGLKQSKLGPAKDNWIGSHSMYDAILEGDPYRIRALVGFGRNFLVNHPNVQRGAEALRKLEFHVQTDVTLTPTASYADIVLPICTPWERSALRVGFEGSDRAERLVQFRQAAIEPLGESRPDAFVVFELAKRLGLKHLFWNGDIDAGLEYILKPLGLTLDDLRKNPNGIAVAEQTKFRRYLAEGFRTATGKVEIYSEVFANEGHDPLPRFVEPYLSPMKDGDGKYPLILMSAKVVHYRHSQDRQVASLRKRQPDPEVTVHPDLAKARSLAENEWVEITTPHGTARMRLKFDSSLHPRVVCAQYGWWQGNKALGLRGFDPFSPDGANFNRLISDEKTDPISGGAPLRSYLCDIRRFVDRSERSPTLAAATSG